MPSSLTSGPAIPICTLPTHELARLRNGAAAATTSPPSLALLSSSSISIDTHRRALKQCSDKRIAGWADTVEAKWEKKLHAKTERQEAREKERERVDAEEAELERLETEATLAQGVDAWSIRQFQSLSLCTAVFRHVRGEKMSLCVSHLSFCAPPWPVLSLAWTFYKHA